MMSEQIYQWINTIVPGEVKTLLKQGWTVKYITTVTATANAITTCVLQEPNKVESQNGGKLIPPFPEFLKQIELSLKELVKEENLEENDD